jgi:LL-diaminopimelate aminotransferase
MTIIKWEANMKQARRLDNAPPYLFVEIEESINKALEKGIDVINLGIGDPDTPTPGFIINKMTEALKDPTYHRYPNMTAAWNSEGLWRLTIKEGLV